MNDVLPKPTSLKAMKILSKSIKSKVNIKMYPFVNGDKVYIDFFSLYRTIAQRSAIDICPI